MTTTTPTSATLPLAHLTLRILIIGNWVMAAGIFTLLFIAPHREWILSSLNLAPSPEAERVIWGLRTIALLGLAAVPLNHNGLKRLLEIVETVRTGDPFVAMNANRLQAIGWILLTLQVLSVIIGLIGRAISSPAHPIDINAGFSINGWLAVLLTFLLARVFAEGARMRDDLEGTV